MQERNKIWINRAELNKEDMLRIANECGLTLPVSAILAKRGLVNCAKRYMSTEGEELYSPYLLPDMEKGVSILINYINSAKEINKPGENINIAIINDYDVDGATSGIILAELSASLGAVPHILTPNRNIDGYGISIRLIDEAIKLKCGLIITCDNGIAAIDQIKYAKDKGLTVIITDHHEVITEDNEAGFIKRQILPNADALINPKRIDSNYPFKEICGAFVAYKFALTALDKAGNINPEKQNDLVSRWEELAGIATVCDVMPLISENRTIVKRAIKKIREGSSYIGLRQLIKVQNINTEKFNTFNIGFCIGPCINSCSRVTGNIDMVTELFLERNHIRAMDIAIEIKKINDERKAESDQNEKSALEMIDNIENIESNDFYILYLPAMNPHIMGIIAGRIKEITNHPCICLTDDKEGILKGSGRSIDGFNMFNAMRKYRDLYISFGGHEKAVGVSIKKENLNKVIEALNNEIKKCDTDIFISKQYVDLFIPTTQITERVIKELEFFEPFGEGNDYPVLATQKIKITKMQRIGEQKKYLRFFMLEQGKSIEGIHFGSADKFDEYIVANYGNEALEHLYKGTKGINLDILYKPEINEWNGKRKIQCQVKDYKIPT